MTSRASLPDEEIIVLGDSNLRDFHHPNCAVLSHSNGRLSHFKGLLNSVTSPLPTAKKFVICLSTLDIANSFSTNSTTLRSLLGAAHRVFPNATLFVLLLGTDDDFSASTKSNIQALNNYVVGKHPSSCLHIPPYPDFRCARDEWDSTTKTATFKKISEFLN